MANKKSWSEKTTFIENIVAGLYVALIFLSIEGIRFFVSYGIKPLSQNELLAFGIPWVVSIAIAVILLVGFSNNLDAKQKPLD